MTTKQYLKALAALKLTPYGKATRELLCSSHSQIAGFAAGTREIPPLVARLLRLMIREHLSPDDVAAL